MFYHPVDHKLLLFYLIFYMLRFTESKLVNETRTTANVSVPAMSGTFTEEMRVNTSSAFLSVAVPFCHEVCRFSDFSNFSSLFFH